jgi:type IV pilus assembly protein PilC
MAFFRFIALDATGNKETSTIYANNKNEAFQILQKMYKEIISIKEESYVLNLLRSFQKQQLFNKDELASTCRQISNYLKSGMSMNSIIQLLAWEENNKKRKNFWLQVQSDFQEGLEFSQCLLPWQERLPAIIIAVLQAAEITGEVQSSFKNLFTYFERISRERNEYLNLFIYPALLIILVLFVILFLSNFVLPSFLTLYGEERILPKATRLLLLFGNIKTLIFILVLIILFFLVFALIYTYSNLRLKVAINLKVLQLPFLGKHLIKQELINLSFSLSLLLACGVDLVKAWTYAIKSIASPYLRSNMEQFTIDLEKGVDLHLVLMRCKVLPKSFTEYVKHGERGNFLGEAFNLIAENYSEECRFEANKLRRFMEPALTVIIALPIVFIAYAILLPIMAQWEFNQIF